MSFDGLPTFDYSSLDGLGGDQDIDGAISEAISVNNIFIEANYLRLDTSNDPITGVLAITGSASVSSDVVVQGRISVFGRIVGQGLVSISGITYAQNAISVGGNIFTQNNLSVSNSIFASNLSISNGITTSQISAGTYFNLPVFDGNVPVRLSVNGSAYINGDVSVSGLITTNQISASTYYNLPAPVNDGNIPTRISVSGSAFIDGNLSISGTAYIKGNVSVLGNCNINSKVSIWDKVFLEGAISVNNDVFLNGNLSMAGVTYNPFGSVIQFNAYHPGNLTPSNYTFNGAYADWVSVTWSPIAYPSTIIVEADAHYYVNGNGADSFSVRVRDNGFSQMYKEQLWANASGGGTRGAVLFPIRCIYANPNGSSRTIDIQISRTSGDDTLTMTQSANQDWSFSITEISV